ncbi:hypothetical protein [Sphingobacterium chungjuense]|uniref:hypothetical protein n=1 Tax=Sphingobacterium chungjuense TaxID=2675553 RepID=UPI00140B2383|nr:hypothetical protein [Sphingobacterium chungjuense]
MSLKKAYTPPTIEVAYIRLEHSFVAGSNNVTPVNSSEFITDEYEQQDEDFDIVW